MYRFDINRQGAAERDFRRAPRPQDRMIRKRILEVDGHVYVAYDAHSLLEATTSLPPPGQIY